MNQIAKSNASDMIKEGNLSQMNSLTFVNNMEKNAVLHRKDSSAKWSVEIMNIIVQKMAIAMLDEFGTLTTFWA